MANQNDNSKRSNKKLIIILVAAFVVVVGVLAGVIIALLGQEPGQVTVLTEATPAPNVLVGLSDDEIAARIEAMQESQANIIVTLPIEVTFADGKAEGKINVQNVAQNEYPFVVDYQLQDGTSVLKTGLIAPGYTLESQALDTDLDPGEYPVSAIHIAYDESGQEVGRVGVAVTFTVEN